MGLMDQVSKPADRALVCTICGDSGMGKTSLAATFPKPIFIRPEDGLQAIPASDRPDAFPVAQTAEQVFDQITALIKEDHEYQTVVFDSVTRLEALFVQDILERDGRAKSINQAMGGYGAGPAAVASMHSRVRKGAGLLNTRRGMHVVFLAHADVETMRLPDHDDYMRYSLRLPAKSLPPYVDDVDVVGFLRLEMFTKGDEGERKKAVATGDRELICYATPANISKNRFGITDAIPVPMGVNPLAGIVPGIPAVTQKENDQ